MELHKTVGRQHFLTLAKTLLCLGILWNYRQMREGIQAVTAVYLPK